NQKLVEYPGNYSFYIEAKSERTEQQQREYESQQQYIKDQEKFINRFRAKASKATAVQSRVKMLDKLDMIETPEEDNRQINIRFQVGQQPGRTIMELKDV